MKIEKKIEKNKKHSLVDIKKRRGFTLIETLVAIFIFALLMVMVSGVFSSFFKNYVVSRKMQKSIENAQYTINIMAKTLRTSDVKTSNSFPIDSFDYSQSKCIRYAYDADASRIQIYYTDDASAAKVSDCNFVESHMTGPYDLTSNNVKSALATVNASASPVFGKVTIALKILEPDQTGDGIPIQTTVSLRQ